MSDPTASARSDFIEYLGLVTQDEGLPRISGRILGLLLFDGRPTSFGELATALQVSRGSISSNARLLLERGLIEKVGRAGDRQDYYGLSDDPYGALLAGIGQRTSKTAADIRKIAATLPQDAEAARHRLTRHADFYGAVSEGILHASDRLGPREAVPVA